MPNDALSGKSVERGPVQSWDEFDRLCNNCGLTWGAHRGNPKEATCPGHEGIMDWDKGPGSVWSDSGENAKIERGTPARRVS